MAQAKFFDTRSFKIKSPYKTITSFIQTEPSKNKENFSNNFKSFSIYLPKKFIDSLSAIQSNKKSVSTLTWDSLFNTFFKNNFSPQYYQSPLSGFLQNLKAYTLNSANETLDKIIDSVNIFCKMHYTDKDSSIRITYLDSLLVTKLSEADYCYKIGVTLNPIYKKIDSIKKTTENYVIGTLPTDSNNIFIDENEQQKINTKHASLKEQKAKWEKYYIAAFERLKNRADENDGTKNTKCKCEVEDNNKSTIKRFLENGIIYRKTFPYHATNSRYTELFFNNGTNDSNYQKFFANSILTVDNSNQKLAFNNELFHDFFGPFRLGIGLSITSAGKNSGDTAKAIVDSSAKLDLAQKLKVGGSGNFFASINIPIIRSMTNADLFNVKLYTVSSIGIDKRKDSSLNLNNASIVYKMGIKSDIYSRGINRAISVFISPQFYYISGNKVFSELFTKEFSTKWFNLNQLSVGLNLSDKYRLRFDYYWSWEKNTKTNIIDKYFPASVSFDLSPF